VFDWGNGTTAVSYGSDRRYGAPADFEAGVRQLLTERGFKVTDRLADAAMVITLRMSMNNSAMCDFLPGTNTDRTCHTVRDAGITFTRSDPAAKQLGSTRIVNRCGSGDQLMTNTQFARFAADWLQYSIEGAETKMSRPGSKC
jgi:hypothetical protein